MNNLRMLLPAVPDGVRAFDSGLAGPGLTRMAERS